MANRLADETSPYLLQHKDNPVDWYPWGPEALQKARDEDKPIFLSVGYAACHWCHVMAHESFEDEAVAAVMNDLFVNVKVDREERPDIDSVYMDAVQAMTGRGGWPMSVFLAADGRPFYGGTYWPSDQFTKVLEAVRDAWDNRRDEVLQSGDRLVEAISARSAPRSTGLPPSILEDAVSGIHALWDHEHGGIGRKPKFPQSMVLELLLRQTMRTGHAFDLALVEQSLERMGKGGIYDQLGGGLSRYSVDERWAVPHFEKMLYDNALLAPVYLHAWQLTGNQWYHDKVIDILDWMGREMRQHGGGLSSSQDADSEGVEGKFFVWTPAQIVEVLGPELGPAACAYFGVSEYGNFENGTTVLSIANEHALDPSQAEDVRRRLFDAREDRVRPGTDDKVLASWNGLAMAAFAEAGRVLDRMDYVDIARGIAHHLLTAQSPAGALVHAWRDGKTGTERFCEDHGAVAVGLLELYQATYDEHWFTEARRLTDEMVDLFSDPQGGFFATASDADALVVRPKDLMDNAVPAPNSLAADALSRMYLFTGDAHYRELAEGALQAVGSALGQQGQGYGRALSVLALLVSNPAEVAVVGPTPETFMSVFKSQYLPFGVVAATTASDTSDSKVPILNGKAPINGQTAAYVCVDFLCLNPVTNPDVFALELAQPR